MQFGAFSNAVRNSSERSSELFRTQFGTFPMADPPPLALTLPDALSISPWSAGRVPA
jgi:hypothetical protein